MLTQNQKQIASQLPEPLRSDYVLCSQMQALRRSKTPARSEASRSRGKANPYCVDYKRQLSLFDKVTEFTKYQEKLNGKNWKEGYTEDALKQMKKEGLW